MNPNTAKPGEPIYDSRNSDEPSELEIAKSQLAAALARESALRAELQSVEDHRIQQWGTTGSAPALAQTTAATEFKSYRERMEKELRDVRAREKALCDHMATMWSECSMALAHLCESANGKKYDPSWIRPKFMSREELNDAVIQSYHRLHAAMGAASNNDSPRVYTAKELAPLLNFILAADRHPELPCDLVDAATDAVEHARAIGLLKEDSK